MLRQYHAPTFRFATLTNPATGRARQVRVGTVPVGTIVTLRDPLGRPARHGTVEVLAWLNREIGAARRVNGRYENAVVAGGHLALVRDLATGTTRLVADHILRHAVEVGGERVPCGTGSRSARRAAKRARKGRKGTRRAMPWQRRAVALAA